MTDKAYLAFKMRSEIIRLKDIASHTFLRIAECFKVIKDDKLWKDFGCSSFGEFCTDPDISYKYSTIRNYIMIYEKFVIEHGIPEDRLVKIGPQRLQIILPVVSNDPEYWLGQAENLSIRDLINEVREYQGKEPMKSNPSPPPNGIPDPAPQDYEGSYKNHVDLQECIICYSYPVDKHHFPMTKGAGTKEDYVIPLCRKCHGEYHQDPKEWTWNNRRKWAEYFYGLILDQFKGGNSGKE